MSPRAAGKPLPSGLQRRRGSRQQRQCFGSYRQPGIEGCSHFSGVVKSVGAEWGVFQSFLQHPIPSVRAQWEHSQFGPSLSRGTWFYLATGIVIPGRRNAHINANAHGNDIPHGEKVQEQQMHQASSSWAAAVGGSALPSVTGLCPHVAPHVSTSFFLAAPKRCETQR